MTKLQTLVANVDLAFVVTSLGPELDARRIERYLVTIWESGASPEIVLTKLDRIDDPSAYVAEVEARRPASRCIVVSAKTGEGCDELRARIGPGVTAVLLGSSGVGKSTLVNRFAGSERMSTGETRADDDEGRHTTTPPRADPAPGRRDRHRHARACASSSSPRPPAASTRPSPTSRSSPARAASTTARTRASRAAPCSRRSRRARSRRTGSRAGASSSASCTRSRSAKDALLRKEETRKWKLLTRDAKSRTRPR